MTNEFLKFEFDYNWEPFTFRGKHITFKEHRNTRLTEYNCSHWGPTIYKWEGLLTSGDHSGKVGILIGETKDLRQRIKQYVSGTQKSGNKFWREQFLNNGVVRLFILKFLYGKILTSTGESISIKNNNLESNNVRLLLEQLLIQCEIARNDDNRWIVNRKL